MDFLAISLADAQTTCDLDWRLAAEQEMKQKMKCTSRNS
jgi:hypothetical protein